MSGSQTVGEIFGQFGLDVPDAAEDLSPEEYQQQMSDDGPWGGDPPETWGAGISIPNLNPDDIQEDQQQILNLDYPATPEEIAAVSPEIDASTVRSRLGDTVTREEIESMNFDPIGFAGSSALDFGTDVVDGVLGQIWESTAGKLVIVLLVVYVVGQLVDVDAGGATSG